MREGEQEKQGKQERVVKATIPISYFHILNALINLTQGLAKSQPRKRMGKKNTDKGKSRLEQHASQFAKIQSTLCFSSSNSCSVLVHISLRSYETLLYWHCVLHKGGRANVSAVGLAVRCGCVSLCWTVYRMSTFLTLYPTSV